MLGWAGPKVALANFTIQELSENRDYNRGWLASQGWAGCAGWAWPSLLLAGLGLLLAQLAGLARLAGHLKY